VLVLKHVFKRILWGAKSVRSLRSFGEWWRQIFDSTGSATTTSFF